ncbi:succinate dehydrogenase assembly factor 2 [Moraxella nasovis]|uniref:FAD assembly factor SdhE n=1 Tax=Moraxella nasovis TaxID=2904121 RepID=UPI001F605C58|nr:succinate dehydrogenase assembly factor 2 [Moraxella nasovis]UNU73634.1 succinate dehydrogenase assembly factor 2 [Moraxella nasovis]
MSTIEPTIEQRRIIYQARRGLKELDFYIDPYVKNHYLSADDVEQAAFVRLLSYEDPDLLLFFLGQANPDDVEVGKLIDKMKRLKYA